MEINEPILALIAALFGGVGLKVIETVLVRSNKRSDIAKEIRDELRDEITDLRVHLDTIQMRLDNWKKEYYALLSAFNDLAVISMQADLGHEVQRIKQSLESHGDDNV